jgi:CheY-like chemotaxis protein
MSGENAILLVEDDPGDVHLAMAIFRTVNMADRLVVASDGQEAMDFLRLRGRFFDRTPGLPALIVLDLKMPRVDGFDLLQQIKADVELKLLPVVVLTSSREARDIEYAYELGVNAYVVKSISFSDYGETLRCVATYWGSVNERVQSAAERSAAKPCPFPSPERGSGSFFLDRIWHLALGTHRSMHRLLVLKHGR